MFLTVSAHFADKGRGKTHKNLSFFKYFYTYSIIFFLIDLVFVNFEYFKVVYVKDRNTPTLRFEL